MKNKTGTVGRPRLAEIYCQARIFAISSDRVWRTCNPFEVIDDKTCRGGRVGGNFEVRTTRMSESLINTNPRNTPLEGTKKSVLDSPYELVRATTMRKTFAMYNEPKDSFDRNVDSEPMSSDLIVLCSRREGHGRRTV
jgi:hypothetical protein